MSVPPGGSADPSTHARVVVRAGGAADLTLGEEHVPVETGSLEEARAVVVALVADRARVLGRAVPLDASDPLGRWRVVVHPDGTVTEAGDSSAEPGDGGLPAEAETGGAAPTTRVPAARSPAARRRLPVAGAAGTAGGVLVGVAIGAVLAEPPWPTDSVPAGRPAPTPSPARTESVSDEVVGSSAATSGPSSTVLLQRPDDRGTDVLLSWDGPDDATYVLLYATDEGIRGADVVGTRTNVSVLVEEGREYCFQVLGLTSDRVVASEQLSADGRRCVLSAASPPPPDGSPDSGTGSAPGDG